MTIAEKILHTLESEKFRVWYEEKFVPNWIEEHSSSKEDILKALEKVFQIANALSWRDVFDGMKDNRFPTFSLAQSVAAQSGYKFVAWSGKVYKVEHGMLKFELVSKVEDLM